jgi:hypothetical protein
MIDRVTIPYLESFIGISLGNLVRLKARSQACATLPDEFNIEMRKTFK